MPVCERTPWGALCSRCRVVGAPQVLQAGKLAKMSAVRLQTIMAVEAENEVHRPAAVWRAAHWLT